MGHLRLIDGLRGLAAFLVLISHVAFWTGASQLDLVGALMARGDAGVAVFFAISAFLLLRPAIRRGMRDHHHSTVTAGPALRTYSVRRAARILPAYWCALIAVLAAAAMLPSAGGIGGLEKVMAHVFVVQGFTGEYYISFTQTWSLTTELTFYALVPVAGLALARTLRARGPRHGSTSVLVALALVAVCGLIAQAVSTAWSHAGSTTGAGILATSLVGHLAWFAAGTALAVAVEARALGVGPLVGRTRLGAVWNSRPTLLLLATTVFVVSATSLGGPTGLTLPSVGQAVFKEAAYALFALLLLAAAAREPAADSLAARVGASGATAWVGNISYGVFLWHVLVLQVVFALTGAPIFATGLWWMLYATLGFSVALASLSWILIERPILVLVRRRPARARAHRA